MQANEENYFQLQDTLYERGLSLKAFADDHGFQVSTVWRTVRRYYGTDQVPPGPVGRKILRKLAEVLAEEPALAASQT